MDTTINGVFSRRYQKNRARVLQLDKIELQRDNKFRRRLWYMFTRYDAVQRERAAEYKAE